MFDRLIDHAALFPPASMELDEALAEDREARSSGHAEVLNRFVVPAARLAELPAEMPPLSVVLPDAAGAGQLEGDDRVRAVELRLEAARPRPADLLAAYRSLEPLDVTTYFELVVDDDWRDSVPAAIGAVAAVGGRVKVRCGGERVPSVEQLALVVACCREARVRFKATAGLHHAVRRGEEHGFLNLMAAVTAPRERIAAVLAEVQAGALELRPQSRELFDGFGSCSWREPIDDLRELGMLS
ncbi:MAG TPA: hypothetical protein VFM57_06810 [Thermoleophilaceae bacterium]|nr:hypothetical protein [Thermoleophilaceae bacterium]